MKKWLLLFLSGAMLFSAACVGGTVETSDPEQSESIDETVSYEVNENTKYTLVSVGKPYVTSSPANETYDDEFGQQLTDGQKTPDLGVHYTDTRMVGYTATIMFQIDLGEDGKRISAVSARSLNMNQDGVALAVSARFAGSQDGKKFTTIGTVNFEKGEEKTVSTATVKLNKLADYRYIRIYMSPSSHFFFIDEIEVFADVDEKVADDTVAEAYKNENIDRNEWKTLSIESEANPADIKNVAVNLKYSFADCEFDERAPKNDVYLTDAARTPRLFGEDVWVGIKANADKVSSISFDLGTIKTNLCSFKVHALGAGLDVGYPDYIDVYGSTDNKDFYLLGRMYAPQKSDNYAYMLLMPEYIGARYIRFDFAPGKTNYWIEEIEIFAGWNQAQKDVFYDPIDFPDVTEELYWASSEPDYTKKQNLLLGLPQQIAATYYADINAIEHDTPANTPILTDGKRAAKDYCYDPEWFCSGEANALDFIYDLGKLSTVQSANVSLLEQELWGIARPKFMSVLLSDDGENWYKVADYARGDVKLNAEATRLELGFDFDRAYVARFVRFRFETGFLFLDELEVFGTKQVKASAIRLADSGLPDAPYYTNPEDQQYATTENTPIKAKDITIVYGDDNDYDALLPYVAYLDEDGKIKDTFMDGFLYCPHGALPSGALPHTENVKTDWDFIYNTCYNGTGGFDTLEQVVQDVKDELDIPDYKVQVYVTILTLRDTVKNFGDVDGDGVSEDLTTAEGRKKVIDWYVNLCMTEFENRNYKNLEFGGFYWVNEAVIWEKDDSAIIAEVAQYVHDAGSYLLWVPYYTANRYYLGYELGFDLVCMQPNVVFSNDAPMYRFPSTAELTKAMKMCVEIEHSYQCMSDKAFARAYMLYLYYGAKYGYMDAIHVYYNDIENFALMAYSDSELCRMQYDATYKFAKHTLEVTPEKREKAEFSVSKDTILRETLNPDNSLSLYTLTSGPENGIVAFSKDGSFAYYPAKDFSGTDSFTYTYNNYLGESEECVVEIKIG